MKCLLTIGGELDLPIFQTGKERLYRLILAPEISRVSRQLCPSSLLKADLSTAAKGTSSSDLCKPPTPQPPYRIVEPGQLIYAQLLPSMTIEGYTLGREDSSHWLDPSLSEEAWPTVPRPAVVLEVSKDWRNKFIVKLAPIARRQLGQSVAQVLLTADENSRETDVAMVLGSSWPLDAIWSYTLVGTATFTCSPDQVRISLVS
jgi:hypothetical protein